MYKDKKLTSKFSKNPYFIQKKKERKTEKKEKETHQSFERLHTLDKHNCEGRHLIVCCGSITSAKFLIGHLETLKLNFE